MNTQSNEHKFLISASKSTAFYQSITDLSMQTILFGVPGRPIWIDTGRWHWPSGPLVSSLVFSVVLSIVGSSVTNKTHFAWRYQAGTIKTTTRFPNRKL